MAAIVTVGTRGTMYKRTGTAQATTGQTDWIDVPAWANYMLVDFNLTAVAGTTPLADLSIQVPDFTTRDDATGVINLMNYTAFTQITAAARIMAQVGPAVTGIADDVTTAATGASSVSINAVLPPMVGVKLLFDRTTGDETYTYTLAVMFKKV